MPLSREADPLVIAIIGLGYVGIPLAVEFGKILPTIGFDIYASKIELLKKNRLPGDEISPKDLLLAKNLVFTNNPSDLKNADYIIIAVPTLVNKLHHPDFGPLIEASKLVGQNMKSGAIVIYESTVYPGATEELCIPELESASKMVWKKDFHVGYSPERVNPGDSRHVLSSIVKIVSGDDANTLDKVAALYALIIHAGVHRASCIKVAETSKVIENTQRDVNIALMNELAIICHLVNIDTHEVIEAASTKWNFIPAYPGLVGGHCIGVVPYYLQSKAEQLGYHPGLISSARKTNEAMSQFIALQVVQQLISAGVDINLARVSILGLSFKENIQDLSNSKIVDVINCLKERNIEVFVCDPLATPSDAKQRYGITMSSWEELPVSHAILVAVPHNEFLSKPLHELLSKLTLGGCFFDLHGTFDSSQIQKSGFHVWRL